MILQKEQRLAESGVNGSDSENGQGFTLTSSAFMYRNDIKEMILLLFALCEYNLRIVFSQGAGTQAPEQQVK